MSPSLDSLLDQFSALGIIPILGAEIECYFEGGYSSHDSVILDTIRHRASNQRISLWKVEGEDGERQYEFSLSPLAAKDLVQQLYALKQLIIDIAREYSVTAVFDALPYPEQPGSGLHIHVSLRDKNDHNLYERPSPDQESDYLLFSVGGLLQDMEKDMPVFAPSPDSYKRYIPTGKITNAPTHIAWGGNNRTLAIRIPNNAKERHLEHRVACADANIDDVLISILNSIYQGIINRTLPNASFTYGNAFDPQYALKPLVSTE